MSESYNSVRSKITELHALCFDFGDSNSPVYGRERNPDNLEPNCNDCIGMCCIAAQLTGLTPQEQLKLESGGTLYDAFFFDRIGGNPRQEALTATVVVVNGQSKTAESQTLKIKLENVLTNGHYNPYASRQIIGPCGYLTNKGKCSIYHDHNKPEICDSFQMGGEACTQRFIARGSDAAQKVQAIINAAAPILAAYAHWLLKARRPVEYKLYK